MSIAPILPIGIPTAPTGAAGSLGGAGAATGGGDLFAQISNALSTVSDAHTKVDQLSVQAATGDLTAVHQLTMATAEAQLLTQLTVEVRNRAVESFNEIMRMQV
ncbi:MAG: flagellar hook-basal body complex protein FliE [Ilumatobacter sp.]